MFFRSSQTADASSSEKKDIYQFDDEDDEETSSSKKSATDLVDGALKNESVGDQSSSTNRLSTASLLDGPSASSSGNRTSMLVLAALGAAAHDLGADHAEEDPRKAVASAAPSTNETTPKSAESYPTQEKSISNSSAGSEDEGTVNMATGGDDTKAFHDPINTDSESKDLPESAPVPLPPEPQPAQPSNIPPIVPSDRPQPDTDYTPSPYEEYPSTTAVPPLPSMNRSINSNSSLSLLSHSAQSLVADQNVPEPPSLDTSPKSEEPKGPPLYLPPISTFGHPGRHLLPPTSASYHQGPPPPPTTSSYNFSDPLPPYNSLYSGLDISSTSRGHSGSQPNPYSSHPSLRHDYSSSSNQTPYHNNNRLLPDFNSNLEPLPLPQHPGSDPAGSTGSFGGADLTRSLPPPPPPFVHDPYSSTLHRGELTDTNRVPLDSYQGYPQPGTPSGYPHASSPSRLPPSTYPGAPGRLPPHSAYPPPHPYGYF